MKKALLLFIDDNLNNFYLDYIFDKIQKKIINILKKDFDTSILIYTDLKEKYKYNFMNRSISKEDFKNKLKLTHTKVIIERNNNKNNIINRDYNEYDYLIHVPNNCYINYNININNNITVDKNSNLFLLPKKYYNSLELLLDKKYENIKNIKYIEISSIHHPNFKIENTDSISKKQINIIKKIVGLEYIVINNIDELEINKDIILDPILKNIDNLYKKYNSKKNRNVAIAIIGQVRTFMYDKVYKSLQKYILKDFEEKKINYVLFFFIENKMQYFYNDKVKKTNTNIKIENISKKLIEEKIKSITSNYNLTFYNLDKIINKIPILGSSQIIQQYLLLNVYKIILKYEKDNVMYFNYIIKSRPDFEYKNYISNFLNFDKLNTFFLGQWDLFFIYPRHVFDIIEKSYYFTISPRTIDLYNTLDLDKENDIFQYKKCIIKKIVKMFQKEVYTYILMYLNNIKVKRIIPKIGILNRPDDN